MRLCALFVAVVPVFAVTTPNDCHILEKHGRIEARDCFSQLAQNRDRALRAEGLWGLQRYEDANTEFRVLVKEQPNSAEHRVRWGRLLMERFNFSDAADLFQEALKLDANNAQAYLGLALIASDHFSTAAVEYAQKALDLDPKLVEAWELMAYLKLEDNNPKQAAEAADHAIGLSGDALDAMAVHATIEWLPQDLLTGDLKSPWMNKIALVNPAYGNAYSIAGHFLILNRRYSEGIRLYSKAVQLSPKLWEARSELGVNLMRLGRNDEARAQLVMCYENGYRNLETTNSLRLLDSFQHFETVNAGSAELVFHKKEVALLKPYFEDVVKRAMAAYESKYHFKLPNPVRVEVYPDHEDFAVRTTGMPGLGALGVTFGTVVAMDSPSGRPPGQFHWGSTLWHEMSHVYVLTATHHLVPRWFTEGLAVYEESIAAPGWGDRLQPDEIHAVRDHKLLPVLELDRGFIRPSYPAQVVVSYFQAGRICAFISEKWNYSKLVDMIYAFGKRKTTAQVIEENLGIAAPEFDRQFLAWLEPKISPAAKNLEDWRKRASQIGKLMEAKKFDDVIREGSAILNFYPDYVEGGSLYEQLSEAYLAKGNKAEARRYLESYAAAGGRNPETLRKLATFETEAGNRDKAIAVLESLNYIYPEDQQLHHQLGSLYLDKKNAAGAIREFRAALDLKPLDQAAAHYDLARAYSAAGHSSEARGEVVRSLEAAPGFKPAQKLLLELSTSEKN